VFEKTPKALKKPDFHNLASKNKIGNPNHDFFWWVDRQCDV